MVPLSLRPTQRRRCRAAAAVGSLRERCATVFEVCDEGNKGYLDREDFEVAVVMLFGYKLSEVEVDSIMSSVRPENSGISFEKFLSLMSAKKSAQLYGDEAREIFIAFDMQDRGFLTFEDFKKTFNSVLPKLSERVIIEAFSFLLGETSNPSEAFKKQQKMKISDKTASLEVRYFIFSNKSVQTC
ncbi:EF-hand calcium-binding domain-containing protein 11 isoform X2 [Coturnix japonica]|uniref:EF-hand calcium-binding domain-containing protein 11 isoform X2 n=1 Tax=Coturnix japonica TaxID=93934 RepID=UPI0013A5C22C|nr:EF-hand calcium-binding domain-containing protein 11 isoform X2 [Coturnix japonica]